MRRKQMTGYCQLDKYKVNYEEIHWSINPEKENIEKCESSATEDDWYIFLERLKYGITLSAYHGCESATSHTRNFFTK